MKTDTQHNLDIEAEPVRVSAISGRMLMQYATVFLAGIAVTFIGLTLFNRTQPAPIVIQPPPPTATPLPTATAAPVQIFVNGAVQSPNVYALAPGSIVRDAVETAGGFTSDAYADIVNLAQPLTDGMQIYVPSQAEWEAGEVAQVPVVVAGSAAAADDGTAAGEGLDEGLININTASKERLESLPGVGPSTAQKILDYRDANGPFASIEALMDVSGIGPAKFEAMQEFVTVGG